MHDYLGLGTKKQKSNDFLDMNSDYLGLGTFAANRAREAGKARRYVKGQATQYRKDIKTIHKEVRAFQKDFKDGGWLGQYIKRKLKERKK